MAKDKVKVNKQPVIQKDFKALNKCPVCNGVGYQETPQDICPHCLGNGKFKEIK